MTLSIYEAGKRLSKYQINVWKAKNIIIKPKALFRKSMFFLLN